MNIVKIQQELIKDCLSGKAHKWFMQKTDTEVILFNRYQMFLLDNKDFLLKYEKLVGAGVKESVAANKILDSADDATLAIRTGCLKTVNKCTLLELEKADNGELVYVDQSLLKYYDKSADACVINRKSPVFIYESDILVGVVLPYKVG